MLILNFASAFFLIGLCQVVQLYYIYRKGAAEVRSISIGSKPLLYTKAYRGITYDFSLLPFVLFAQEFTKVNIDKYQSINGFFLRLIPFGSIFIVHSLSLIFFGGLDFWYAFYKSLLFLNIDEENLTIMSYNLGKLIMSPITFFLIAALSVSAFYLWFMSIVRNALEVAVKKVLGLLNINPNSTFIYLIPTVTMLYFYLSGNAYLLLFNLQYTPTFALIIDIFAAHIFLMVIYALVLEILSRIELSKNPT